MFPIFQPAVEHDEFLSFESSTYTVTSTPFPDPVTQTPAIAIVQLYIDLLSETQTREIYNILDLFGDFGGLMEVLIIVTELIVAPWAEHIFNLKAIQKLFFVKSRD